jgi:hypothetical protein
MQYDPVVKILKPTLTDLAVGVSFNSQHGFQDIVKILPPGWQLNGTVLGPLFRLVEGFKDTFYISLVKIDKGLVRASPGWVTDEEKELAFIFNAVAQPLAAMSSKRCVVCGKTGSRRKPLEYWPCLCVSHYIQYANWLDQNE